jgi:hypothetical protein
VTFADVAKNSGPAECFDDPVGSSAPLAVMLPTVSSNGHLGGRSFLSVQFLRSVARLALRGMALVPSPGNARPPR